MSKTFKMVTIVGTSDNSYEDAMRNGVEDASQSLRNMYWFEVQELRGRIDGGQIAEFQVKMQVGLKVETD